MSYKRLTTKGSNYYDDRKVTCAEEIYEQLKDLEDKIENGTLIFRKKPKRKYYALILRSDCYGKFVWHIDYAYIEYEKENSRVAFNVDGRLFTTRKDLLFETKAEAEAKLKELKGEL